MADAVHVRRTGEDRARYARGRKFRKRRRKKSAEKCDKVTRWPAGRAADALYSRQLHACMPDSTP